LTRPAAEGHNRLVNSARRFLCVGLAFVVLLAGAWARPAAATPAGDGRHASQGCQAAGPPGNHATLEAADVARAVHESASAAVPIRTGSSLKPVSFYGASPSRSAFARPHDPPHLHAFSPLI
jgi:hypothetical protein